MMDLDLNEKIKMLLGTQKFAVLSTENDRQPYSNLIAFAECGKEIIFFTQKNTRKYKNLVANNRIALMIDNRTNQSRDFVDATAITLIGTAEEIDVGNLQQLLDAFITKHPDLADLSSKNENAFFKARITDYIVASFNSSVRVQF